MIFLGKPDIELLYEGARVQFQINKKDNAALVNMLADIKPGEEYDFFVKKHREKRSLNANNYHWMLCEQIAKILKTGKYEVHNQLLIDYGTDWLDENGELTLMMLKDDDKYLHMETTHIRPTDRTEFRNGEFYRWFVLLKPSSEMDTAEMSVLIDGTVYEAKELGIDTRTPDEIERMKQLWENRSQAY